MVLSRANAVSVKFCRKKSERRKEGDMKYIIDIPKTVGMTEKVGSVHYTYFDGIQCQTIILKSDEIEELNSEYVNEHFGDLQDEAYQKGFEDGKAVHEKGCEGCKHEGESKIKAPCILCSNNFRNQWQAKQTDDILIDIIRNGIHNWVTELNVKLDDIASILEDMRND